MLETDGINMELRMYDDDETSKDDRIGEWVNTQPQYLTFYHNLYHQQFQMAHG